MELYESESIELKAIYTPDLKKEIVAFANTNSVVLRQLRQRMKLFV